MVHSEERGNAFVAWIQGIGHAYEDRYRILSGDIALVAEAGRGELFGCFDGIGSAPLGMRAAQAVADALPGFFRQPDRYPPSAEGLKSLLLETNQAIHDWGLMPGTDRPLGGCAGTVAWVNGKRLVVFHAGDTEGLLLTGSAFTRLTRPQERDGGIFNYFGRGPGMTVEIASETVRPDDRILLVSDGVTKVFQIHEAARLVQSIADPGEAAAELASRSRGKGSRDDITVVLIEIVGD